MRYNGFTTKSIILPKGDESSGQNCIKFVARNATTKRISIAMERMLMDAKNICAGIAGTSGRQETTRMRWLDALERRSILPALSAERRCICIMIRCTTSTTPARIRSAGILSLFQSLPLSQPHPCPNCSARKISNGCAILFM